MNLTPTGLIVAPGVSHILVCHGQLIVDGFWEEIWNEGRVVVWKWRIAIAFFIPVEISAF